MTIIADTSYLFALYNSKDINHRAAATFAFATASERMLLPDVALTELAYLLVRDLGYVALRTLLENLRDSEIELVPLFTYYCMKSDHSGKSRHETPDAKHSPARRGAVFSWVGKCSDV